VAVEVAQVVVAAMAMELSVAVTEVAEVGETREVVTLAAAVTAAVVTEVAATAAGWLVATPEVGCVAGTVAVTVAS